MTDNNGPRQLRTGRDAGRWIDRCEPGWCAWMACVDGAGDRDRPPILLEARLQPLWTLMIGLPGLVALLLVALGAPLDTVSPGNRRGRRPGPRSSGGAGKVGDR